MNKLSYTGETMKKPYFWLILVCAALLMTLVKESEVIDLFSRIFAFICLGIFIIILFKQNNSVIRSIKYKTGKRLGL